MRRIFTHKKIKCKCGAEITIPRMMKVKSCAVCGASLEKWWKNVKLKLVREKL